MLALALFVILYALADRYAGGGWPWLDARLPGRAALWAGLLAAVASYFLAGWVAVALAVAWGVHRTLPFRLFGGSAAPESAGEIGGTFLRYAILAVPVGLIAAAFGLSAFWAILVALCFALVATFLAMWYGGAVARARARRAPIGSENTAVELIRGAAWGLAVWSILL